jgi:REP element-mobilizing transposase RayT
MQERKNIRLKNWDYATPADYFITICTKNREHYFGEIADAKMVLSNTGVIAYILWYEIKNHAKNIELGEFIVMPNHIHGIISIVENNDDADAVGDGDVNPVGTGHAVGSGHAVETGHALSLRQQQRKQQIHPNTRETRFQNIGKNTISSIIGSYKSAVTKYARRLGFDFEWQTRFYDHIIRDKKHYNTIVNYIKNNPENWTDDKFYNN